LTSQYHHDIKRLQIQDEVTNTKRNNLEGTLPMEKNEVEIELIDFLNIIWNRKWFIIISTFLLVILVGGISFLLPKKWEVDAIIEPSKFLIQTVNGQFEEIMVIEPIQITGQINEKTYNGQISSDLNIDPITFPKLKAENLPNTNLVRISIKDNDRERAKLILTSLFNYLKEDFDKKINVEIKDIDTQIATLYNSIKFKELIIKDKLDEIKITEYKIRTEEINIQSKEIQKTKTEQEITSAENKLKISEGRVESIMAEMKSVKIRIDKLEEQLKTVLAQKKEGSDAIVLLLYTNEVQNNLRYYNTLDEKLNYEKITQENLQLLKKERKEETKQLDTEIEKLKTEINTLQTQKNKIKTEIDKINNEIEDVNNQADLLKEKKGRMDYTQLIKEPTSSFQPVFPQKKLYILIAGIFGLIAFTLLAFFLEYLGKQKEQIKQN